MDENIELPEEELSEEQQDFFQLCPGDLGHTPFVGSLEALKGKEGYGAE